MAPPKGGPHQLPPNPTPPRDAHGTTMARSATFESSNADFTGSTGQADAGLGKMITVDSPWFGSAVRGL
jgi:hypothetical protein